jgi:hypothetical protein
VVAQNQALNPQVHEVPVMREIDDIVNNQPIEEPQEENNLGHISGDDIQEAQENEGGKIQQPLEQVYISSSDNT